MKILISDIDSSMFDLKDKKLKESIKKFTSYGHLFVIATSKAINYVADYLALNDVDVEYYICNDGAVIFDRYFNVIYRKDLKSDVINPIMNTLDSDDNILESFIDTSHGFSHDITKCANGIVARSYDSVKAEILLNTICLKYPSVHGHISDNWLNIVDIERFSAFAMLSRMIFRLAINETHSQGSTAARAFYMLYVFVPGIDDIHHRTALGTFYSFCYFRLTIPS